MSRNNRKYRKISPVYDRTAKDTDVSVDTVKYIIDHVFKRVEEEIVKEEPNEIRIIHLGAFKTNEKRFYKNKKGYDK